MNGKQCRRSWRLGLFWLALLLGFYVFGIQVGPLFGPTLPCQPSCDCAQVEFWALTPYTNPALGDFVTVGTVTTPVLNALINLNCPSSTTCQGTKRGTPSPCTQYQVGNTNLACSPATMPGLPWQCVPAGGGGMYTLGPLVGPSNSAPCN